MKSHFTLFLSFFVFVFLLSPLRAEENPEEKQLTTLEQFQEVLKQNQIKPLLTFLEENRQEMFEALNDPDLEAPERNMVLYNVYLRVAGAYRSAKPEMQETLIKESKTFYEANYKNEDEKAREICEDILETLQFLPIKTKLDKDWESLLFEEQLLLLLKLKNAVEPLKFAQGGFAQQAIVGEWLSRGVDKRLKNRTQRELMIPVLEVLAKLFASKDNKNLKFLAWKLEQTIRQVQSEGKTASWDDMSFTALDGRKMKIADFRGKPLVLAFQATDGGHTELLKDCAEHWKSEDVQLLFITSKFRDATMKKFVEVCEISFPVWNVAVSGLPKEKLDDALPPHWFACDPVAMLIDAEGKVVNSYFSYENLPGELGKLFGVPANDESLDNIWKKSRDFTKELHEKKLLEIPEDATVEQMHQRFVAALTYLLTPYKNTFSAKAPEIAAQLPELAQRIAAKTDDRKMIESMYEGMLFLAKIQPYIPSREPRFTADLIEQSQQQQFLKIAAEAKLIEFRVRFQTIFNVRLPNSESENPDDILALRNDLEKFIELRKEAFNFVRESKDDCSSGSVVLLFRTIGSGITRRYSDDVVAETYQEMADVLEEMNDPSIKSTIETYRGVATRLLLLGKEMNIEGETLNGKPFDPALYKGKVVLVDFWATWCGPCIAEIPNMKKAYEKYHEKGFEIVAISTDRELDALKEYLEEKPLPWICLADELAVQSDKPVMRERYGVETIPTMILIDRNGRVVLLEARDKALTDKLEELFAE